MCTASRGAEDEFFLGGLFISDEGLAFDSGSHADVPGRLRTGLVRWSDVSSLRPVTDQSDGKAAVLELCVEAAPWESHTCDVAKLHLQLDRADAEWIETLWVLSTKRDNLVDAETCVNQTPPATQDRVIQPSPG